MSIIRSCKDCTFNIKEDQIQVSCELGILDNIKTNISGKRRLEIARSHLREIRRNFRRLNEKIQTLEEQVKVLEENKDK